MPKKRRSGGKTGSSSGRDRSVVCSKCHRTVPRGKAKRVTRYVNLMEPQISKELREAGAIIPQKRSSSWYCVSCAIHTHKVNIRSGGERKDHTKL